MIFAVLFSFVLQASFLDSKRKDPGVPKHCQTARIGNFAPGSTVELVTYSTFGAKNRGFTHEYPLSKKSARFLFKVFKKNQHNNRRVMDKIRRSKRLNSAYSQIRQQQKHFNFRFNVVGDIMEALALSEIVATLPKDLFVTGGMVYSQWRGSRTLGEIDIWVAKRSNCQVIRIGEVKLNPRALGKARKQLGRFRGFVSDHQRRKGQRKTKFRWANERRRGNPSSRHVGVISIERGPLESHARAH